MTPAGGPQPPPDQLWVSPPVAARIRAAMSRAGFGILVAGALLVVVTVVLVLTAPGANGFLDAITISGATTGGLLILFAGIGLLNARRAVSGQSLLLAHARRIQRLLVVLLLLSLVMTAVYAYGAAAVADGPVVAAFLVPIGSCVLIGIAVSWPGPC